MRPPYRVQAEAIHQLSPAPALSSCDWPLAASDCKGLTRCVSAGSDDIDGDLEKRGRRRREQWAIAS